MAQKVSKNRTILTKTYVSPKKLKMLLYQTNPRLFMASH